MTPTLLIVLYTIILFTGITLFIREVFPLEISALLILVLLVVTGILKPQEAFDNFGNQALIMIGSLFVLIDGLTNTGVIRTLEGKLQSITGENRNLSFILLLIVVGAVSAFVSNTATLAVSIPIVTAMARKFDESPKLWLMPIAFASVLGGMNSLIGTSTNIIISGLLPDYGLSAFNLFTTATYALPLSLIGVLYLVFFAKYLLPKGDGAEADSIDLKYDLRAYTTEFTVLEDSDLIDKTMPECAIFREADITVLGIVRQEHLLLPRQELVFRKDDRLVVEGNITSLTEISEKYGVRFDETLKQEEETSGDKTEEDEKPKKKKKKSAPELQLHEVLITSQSFLNNKTPAEVYLRNRYRISLIAINRQGVTLRSKLSTVRMLPGDILVVQFLGYIDNSILDYLGLVPLKALEGESPRSHLAPLAITFFVLSLVLGSISPLPLALTCLTGAILMVITGIVKAEEMYQGIEWRVLLFIGAILCLGRGMETSGTAALIAENLSGLLAGLPPSILVGFFFLFTVILTQLLSNQATAVVMIPLAISTASTIGINPHTLVMTVTMAASCCFMTPFEPAFLLVYGPGGYKFTDFFRVGLILALAGMVIAMVIIPIAWPV